MVNKDNEAGFAVSHNASAAAIFIGWSCTMCWAWVCPTSSTRRIDEPNIAAI